MPLTSDQFDALRRLDTCLVSNAIENFAIRLRNEGFADGSVRCLFPQLPVMIGHAVTLRIRCSGPPVEGRTVPESTDWLEHALNTPPPRVLVIQDLDATLGRGAWLGEVHANILMALGFVGAVTNGAARDLPAVSAMGFPVFARHTAVSHAYAHIISSGGRVEVGGLGVEPGDLLMGDIHGVLSVPAGIAAQVPTVAERIQDQEREVIGLCRTPDFSMENLRKALRERGLSDVAEPLS